MHRFEHSDQNSKKEKNSCSLSLASLWHKDGTMGHPARIEFSNNVMLVQLANHYIKWRGSMFSFYIIIFLA